MVGPRSNRSPTVVGGRQQCRDLGLEPGVVEGDLLQPALALVRLQLGQLGKDRADDPPAFR